MGELEALHFAVAIPAVGGLSFGLVLAWRDEVLMPLGKAISFEALIYAVWFVLGGQADDRPEKRPTTSR
ncbi:MAG: hypothetical protein AAF291_09860 [Pseudomonadota bacterium]